MFKNIISMKYIIVKFLLKDYCHVVERLFAYPSDPESYAGGSTSSLWSHPCHTDQRAGAKQNVVPGPPGSRLDVG
jgi:hypothetical protein